MSQTVSIVLKLKDKQQSHYFEKHLRNMFFNGEVISYADLPDTDKLYESSEHFKTLIKGVKKAQRLRDDYIQKHN